VSKATHQDIRAAQPGAVALPEPPPAPTVLSTASWTRGLRTIALVAVILALMTAWAIAMLVVAVPTLFMARRFYAEVLAKALGRTVLRLLGMHLVVHQTRPFPVSQTIFVSNHSSTLDAFILIALGLPRTRFFMGGWLRRIVPVAVIGYLIRNIWTVPQSSPARRVRIFQRTDRILRKTGDSVYLSPEGMRVTSGGIGHFNKGSFHLATSLGAAIVPLYIKLPPGIGPAFLADTHPGTAHVLVLPEIDTKDWRLEDLERNRAMVRDLFVRVHEEMSAGIHAPSSRAPLHPNPVTADP